LPRRRPQHDAITTKLPVACSDKKDMLPTAAGPKHRPHRFSAGHRARTWRNTFEAKSICWLSANRASRKFACGLFCKG
jgi:hypothetical protein